MIKSFIASALIGSIPVEISNIRAGRQQPGLRPQHLTCVEAASEICAARVEGAYVGSERILFSPTSAIRAGDYCWQVNTAGSAALVMQTVLLPLALAPFSSRIEVRGGTHVPNSPSAHYLRDVYAPMLIQSGADVIVELPQFGWFPQGGGNIVATIAGRARLRGQQLLERGELERIFGLGLATNLPAHIPQRLSDRARAGLEALDRHVDIRPELSKGTSTGAGVFLAMEYTNGRAGVGIIGEKGVPSEDVANQAISEANAFHRTKASVDAFLADQLLLILALAEGESAYLTPRITRHLETNRWVIQQFLDRSITFDSNRGLVKVAK